LITLPFAYIFALRSFEKRKQAAMDIQSDIESLIAAKDENSIIQKIKFFSVYTEDDNVIKKRAGIYGISVIAVSLYQKVSCPYSDLSSCFRNQRPI
jgi:hypothetical protein